MSIFAVGAATFQAADASIRACCVQPVGVDLMPNVIVEPVTPAQEER
jgi:hypothetical protein